MNRTNAFDQLKRKAKEMSENKEYSFENEENMEMSELGIAESVEMKDIENRILSTAERNIMQCLRINSKFSVVESDNQLDLSINTLAKSSVSTMGVTNIKGKSNITLDFKGKADKLLAARKAVVILPDRNNPNTRNEPRVAGILAGFSSGVSPIIAESALSMSAGERLSAKWDYRHLMAKMYLTIMDINLMETMGRDDLVAAEARTRVVVNAKGKQVLSAIVRNNCTIDATEMGEDEIGALIVMSQPYPCVKSNEKSIYNTIKMKRDDIIIVTRKDELKYSDVRMSSSTSLTRTLFTLAAKLDCLEQLEEVIKGFRGVPRLLEDMAEFGVNRMQLKYPVSHGHNTCGRIELKEKFIGGFSNLIGSSMGMCSDYLLGEVLIGDVFTIIEELGGTGPIGVPTYSALNDPVFNSNTRDFGLKHSCEGANAVSNEFRTTKEISMPIDLGIRLKDYVMFKARKIIDNNLDTRGEVVGPMLYMKPTTTTENSTRNLVYSWNPRKYMQPEDENRKSNERRAFGFMMGKTTKCGRVGYNAYGMRYPEVMDTYDNDMERNAEGLFNITNMTIGFSDSTTIRGRTDEVEEYNQQMLNVGYTGTATIIVDKERNKTVTVTESGDEFKNERVHTTLGHTERPRGSDDEEKIDKVTTYGGATLTREKRGRSSPVLRRPLEKVKEEEKTNSNSFEVKGLKGPKLDMTRRHSGDLAEPLIAKGGGKKYKHTMPPVVDEVNKGKVRMTRIKTVGDGRCGIHAAAQDLSLHGLGDKENYERCMKILRDGDMEMSWQTGPCIGEMLNSKGIGLSILYPAGNGKAHVENYGTGKAKHIVRMICDNNHYENVVIGEGEEVEIVGSEGIGLIPKASELALRMQREISKYENSESEKKIMEEEKYKKMCNMTEYIHARYGTKEKSVIRLDNAKSKLEEKSITLIDNTVQDSM